MRILVCASGGGSNFDSLVRKSWIYQSYQVCGLVVDRDCGAIEVANRLQIPSLKIRRNTKLDDQLKAEFLGFDLIVLAGFMTIISESVIRSVDGKIINTHPSLLPKHGGRGMYGVRVQESVLNSKDEFAGCTIHKVSSELDGGPILSQAKLVIPHGTTAWKLGGLVHELERELLPLTVHRIAQGEILI